MNATEICELDVHELNAVAGGSARDAACIEAYAVARQIDALLNEPEPVVHVPMKL